MTTVKSSIIVIGGGLSGITTAQQLTMQGFNVTIMEARLHLGGRIHTTYLKDGTVIELGSQFIHGLIGNPLAPLFEKYDLHHLPINYANMMIYDQEGKEIQYHSLMCNKELLKKLKLPDKDRISKITEPLLLELFRSTIHKDAVYAPDRKQSLMSYKLGLAQDYGGGNQLIISGLNKLIEGLLSEAMNSGYCDVKTHHIVRRVMQKKDKVVILTNQGEFAADAVVCTVPLGVLKQNGITFKPDLNVGKMQAIENLGVAIHEKTILQFEHSFCPDNIQYMASYDKHSAIWREIINLHHFIPGQAPTLIISNHADTEQLDKSDQELVANTLEMLKHVFGNNLSALKYSAVTRWHRDPYAYGSYSYHTKATSLNDNHAIAEPQGRICFAGEHTSSFPSSLDGAYLSGIQAAKDVIQQLATP